MKVSILHISDLHRDPANPIRNDVLLNSLENDKRRYVAEGIRAPDLVVASGDIVQGVLPTVADPEKMLERQYDEAAAFLGDLADRFLAGNRARLIIVPGNHDVNSHLFHGSLQRIDIVPDRQKGLVRELFAPGSRLRWSWNDFSLYKIVDEDKYARRFAAFAQFYAAFYRGKRHYDLDPAKQVEVFDFPEFGISLVGLSSCHNNDLLNRQAAIHPACIATAGDAFRDSALATRLRIAVWHHNAEGPPSQSDYMDPDIVQNLIDRGFSLGLHGHQHRPQFLDTRFNHGASRKISIISAGTLCGGPTYLHGRSYNVLEIDPERRQGRVHVREMQNNDFQLPIWARRALPPNTEPYYDFGFDAPPQPLIPLDRATVALVKAQELHARAKYREAAEILSALERSDSLARVLLLDCLVRLRDNNAIIAAFDPPAASAEAVELMHALWAEGKRDRLKQVLELSAVTASPDSSVAETRAKFLARLRP